MRTYVSLVEIDVDKLISFSLRKYDCKLKKKCRNNSKEAYIWLYVLEEDLVREEGRKEREEKRERKRRQVGRRKRKKNFRDQ